MRYKITIVSLVVGASGYYYERSYGRSSNVQVDLKYHGSRLSKALALCAPLGSREEVTMR